MFHKLFLWFLTFRAAPSAADALDSLGGLPKSGGTLESDLNADGNKITGLGAGSGSGDSVEYNQFTTALGDKADAADLSAKLDSNGGTWSNGTLGTNLDADGFKVTGLAAGSGSGDSVEYSQFITAVNAAVYGLDLKADVYVACPANITISSPGSTLDGVTFNSPADLGKRVALIAQSTGSQNGIYEWNGASSAMTRTADCDADAEVTTGLAFSVRSGTSAGSQYRLTTSGTIVVGTTSLTFSLASAVQLSNDPPENLADAADEGVSAQASRADHVHSNNGLAKLSGATFAGDVTLAALVVPPQVITADDSVDSTSLGVVISCHVDDVVVSLPASAGAGRVIFLKRFDMGSPDVNTCTIDAAGSDTVEDETGTDVGSITLVNRGAVKLWDAASGKWVVIP